MMKILRGAQRYYKTAKKKGAGEKMKNIKKTALWVFIITFTAFIIDWAYIGIKLIDGTYDFTLAAYIGLALLILIFASLLTYKFCSGKCPNCGKLRLWGGEFCSYCGKKYE